MHPVLGLYFGFEYSVAVKVFMVGFAALGMLAALLIRLSLTQWIFAGMLFATALTAPPNQAKTGYLPTWMLPVQIYKAELHLALGLLLTVMMLFSGRIQLRRVPIQSIFLMAITVYAGLLMFFHETPADALQSLGFGLAVVPCMMAAAPAVCRDYEGCLKCVRSMMVCGAVWAVCCSIQFVINPQFLVNSEGGRFWGMMANAQGATMYCAPMVIIAIWLALNDPQKRAKPVYIAMIAINLLFVGWSGSRTGFLMVVLGSACVLYNRVGKVVLFLPIAGVVLWALAFLSDELQIQNNLDRLTSTEDTRHGVWQAQMQNIADSPLFGVGWHDAGGSESSWLGGFAGYGILMFVIMISFLIYSIGKCASLWVRRKRLPKAYRPLLDLFVSFNAMYFAAATFEGILLGRSSSSQVYMLIFGGIGVWLTEQIARPAVEAAESRYESEEHDAVDAIDEHASEDYGFDLGPEGYGRSQTA